MSPLRRDRRNGNKHERASMSLWMGESEWCAPHTSPRANATAAMINDVEIERTRPPATTEPAASQPLYALQNQ